MLLAVRNKYTNKINKKKRTKENNLLFVLGHDLILKLMLPLASGNF